MNMALVRVDIPYSNLVRSGLQLALDAAAYLPDAPVPEAPAEVSGEAGGNGNLFAELAAHVQSSGNIPRPVVASDPTHPGVKRLVAWSMYLWSRGRQATHLNSTDRSLLALVCGSLLTSVPEAALLERTPGQDMWRAVADFVLSTSSADAAAGLRLALRFCGFAIDRHLALAQGLAASAVSLQRVGQKWLPKSLDSAEDDETDEWKVVDDKAVARVRSFLKAAVPVFKDADFGACAESTVSTPCEREPASGLASMD